MFSAPGDFAAQRTDSFRLADGPFTQESIAAATARDGTALVTWRERSDATGGLALYATRLAPNGTILDANSIRIADATLDGTHAAVASDGRDFLVAWSQPDRIVLRRIGSDGRFLDDTPAFIFTASATTSSPALAWNGSEYLLAFNHRENGVASATYTTQIALVSAAGSLLEPPNAINRPLSTAGSGQVWTYSYTGAPLVASDGRDFLVVYTKQGIQPPPGSSVTFASAATRVTAAGNVVGADAPIVLPAPKALFWNGTTYVALDNANLGYPHGDYGYYGVRINSEGLPLDGLPGGTPASSGPLLPGYYSDFGVQPLCDATGCYAAGTWAPAFGTLQLFVWRVTDANGTFDKSDPLLVAEMPATRRGSSAVALPGSVARLLYTRVATEPELLSVSRVFLKTVQPPRPRAVHH